MTFEKTVRKTPHLENAWRAGLGALRAEDKPHIDAEDTRKLRGSVDVDSALLATQPNANRWDFAIGYQHTNRTKDYIYWVETHTGSDNQIAVVLRKFEWLKNWWRGDGSALAQFECEVVWIPSGATAFTKGSQQVKLLAQKGVRYSGRVLRIPNAHPTPTE